MKFLQLVKWKDFWLQPAGLPVQWAVWVMTRDLPPLSSCWMTTRMCPAGVATTATRPAGAATTATRPTPTFPMSISSSKLSGAHPKRRWLLSAELSSATRKSSIQVSHSTIWRPTMKSSTLMSVRISLLPSQLAMPTRSAVEMPLGQGMF